MLSPTHRSRPTLNSKRKNPMPSWKPSTRIWSSRRSPHRPRRSPKRRRRPPHPFRLLPQRRLERVWESWRSKRGVHCRLAGGLAWEFSISCGVLYILLLQALMMTDRLTPIISNEERLIVCVCFFSVLRFSHKYSSRSGRINQHPVQQRFIYIHQLCIRDIFAEFVCWTFFKCNPTIYRQINIDLYNYQEIDCSGFYY